MPLTLSGTSGASLVAPAAVVNSSIAAGAVTPDKLSGNQTGSAPVYGCRAWCVFNGTLTGTNAPIAGGNVTSVTRNSTGNYTVTLTTAMPTASFATFANAGGQNRETGAVSASTTTITLLNASTAGTLIDEPIINVAVFG